MASGQRARHRPAIALAPGSMGASKRWTYYPQAARLLAEHGFDVWVIGGPGEKALAQEIVAVGGAKVRDLTGNDLRNGILAMASASVAISNDSGLMHIAAASARRPWAFSGRPAPICGRRSTDSPPPCRPRRMLPCQPCQRTVCTMNDHRCMRDIAAADVVAIVAARAGRAATGRGAP